MPTQGNPNGANAGWDTSFSTNNAKQQVPFTGYSSGSTSYDVDVTAPEGWTVTNNGKHTVNVTVPEAGTYSISASNSSAVPGSGGGDPKTMLVLGGG